MLKSKIDNEAHLKLIVDSIKTPTVDWYYKSNGEKVKARKKGIPEGLPTSNILANIYLLDIFNFFKTEEDIAIYKYVDDVLIFYNDQEDDMVIENIKKYFEDKDLEIHEVEKKEQGVISDKFDYLGYSFNQNWKGDQTYGCISVRKKSVNKFEKSIERICAKHRSIIKGIIDKKNAYDKDLSRETDDKEQEKIRQKLNELDEKLAFYNKVFEFKLNLRITGCIINKKSVDDGFSINDDEGNVVHLSIEDIRGKKYGWLFYYSLINDKKLLHHLDWLVKRLMDRCSIGNFNYEIRKFSIAYDEIRKKAKDSIYIYNFTKFTNQDKRKFLQELFSDQVFNIKDKSDHAINNIFYKLITREAKHLEKDIFDTRS